MTTSKHHADAYVKVLEYIDTLPTWSKKICTRLREIILKSDSEIIEDYNWGPCYIIHDKILGFAAHKKHVGLTFYQGTLLSDKHNILLSNSTNPENKNLYFADAKDIDESILREYIAETIDNNRKGKKVLQANDKTVLVAPDIQREFKAAGVLNYFNSLAYSNRREYIDWIADSKKDETRKSRILKVVEMLNTKQKN